MNRVSRGAVVVLTLLMPACSAQEKSAVAAISSVEAAYDAIRIEARSVAPDQARAIDEAIVSARGRVEERDFKGAMALVRDLQPRVKELSDRLPGMRVELETAWQRLRTSLPGALASLGRDVRRSSRPAPGPRRVSLDTSRNALYELEDLWGDAQAAMEDGRLAEAVSTAEDVRVRLGNLAADVHEGS